MAKATKATKTVAKEKTATAAAKTAEVKEVKATAAKATAAKTAAVKATEEVKAAPVKAAEEVKAAPAKKTTRTCAKKAVEVKPEVYVEFGTAQVSIDEVIENVKKTYAAESNNDEVKAIKVYLKPAEHAAYYVINDTVEGKMDVYFC